MGAFWPLSSRAKIGLLIASSLAALGIRFCWGTPSIAIWFQSNLGYYVVLGLLAVWVVFAVQVGLTKHWFAWSYWRPHRAALLVIGAVSVYLHLHEPHVMRVLFDEPTHALNALVMHWEKRALVTAQSNYVGDAFVLTYFHATFRQYFFSLLVSLLHDFTGYRVGNVFVINFLLTPIILLNGYLLSFKLAGRVAGFVTVGFLGTLPLLAQNVTSGGYDALNVALLGGLMGFMLAYAHSPMEMRRQLMNLCLATALLLAVTRYESVLYLLPLGLLIAVTWWRERRVELTGFSLVSPFFLLPNFMSNLLMMSGEKTMYANLRPNGEAFFDIGNLPKHVSEAVFYFFNFDRASTNSVVLSLVGVVGFVALIIHVAGAAQGRRKIGGAETIVALFAVFTTAVYVFMLTQFWSSPADILATRFSLSLLFIWAIVGGWFSAQFSVVSSRPAFVWGALVIWGVLLASSVSSHGLATLAMPTGRAEKWFLEYAGTRDRARTLYVAASNAALIVNRYAASGLDRLNDSPSVFVRAIKAGLYREVIVYQTLEPDPETGQWQPRFGSDLSSAVVLETIDEKFISPVYQARISRLVGFKDGEGQLITPESDDPSVSIKTSFESGGELYAYRLSLYP